jgi:hypothetical protein
MIVGAGTDRARERPAATPAEVVALVVAITPRYRAGVPPATWCGLLWGEVIGLIREDVDRLRRRSDHSRRHTHRPSRPGHDQPHRLLAAGAGSRRRCHRHEG